MDPRLDPGEGLGDPRSRRPPPPYHYYVANISGRAPVVAANCAPGPSSYPDHEDHADPNGASAHVYRLPRPTLSQRGRRPRAPSPPPGPDEPSEAPMYRYYGNEDPGEPPQAQPPFAYEQLEARERPRRQLKKRQFAEPRKGRPESRDPPGGGPESGPAPRPADTNDDLTTIQIHEIVERITDEFQFLEERAEFRAQRQLSLPRGGGASPAAASRLDLGPPAPGPLGPGPKRWSPGGWWLRSYHRYVFVSLAVLQTLVAVGLFAFAVLRFRRASQIFARDGDANGLRLLDFVKAEDYAGSTREGTAIVAIKLGAAIFVPALLQFCAGISALFPLYRRPPKYYMMLNLLFSGFAVVFWMEPIYLAALELNLRNVQINSLHDSASYRLSIAVVAVLGGDALVAGSALAVYAAAHLASASRTPNSALDAHVNMVALLAGVVCVALSAHITAVSMSHVAQWPSEAGKLRRDLVALYGVGLKELIVCSYALVSTLFACTATLLRRKSLRLGAVFTQSVSLFCVLNYLLNADRIIATSFNSQQMIDAQIASPFNGVILIMLYAFIVILAISFTIQLGAAIVSVFPFAPVTVYATPLSLPYRSAINQNYQPQPLRMTAA